MEREKIILCLILFIFMIFLKFFYYEITSTYSIEIIFYLYYFQK